MTDGQMHFELMSPTKKLADKLVTMVTMPGTDGEFGVLIGHTPLMGTLRHGLVKTYAGDTVIDRIFITGGFAEISYTRCIVLAQDAVNLADISQQQIEAELAELDRLFAAATETAMQESLTAQREMAVAKLAALVAPQ